MIAGVKKGVRSAPSISSERQSLIKHSKDAEQICSFGFFPCSRNSCLSSKYYAIQMEKVGNVPNIGSVRNLVRAMKRNGELKEVVNKKSRLLKLYAFPDVDAGDVVEPLVGIVSEVLGQANAPMRPIEICVWLIENDKALDGDPSAAVGQVLRTLKGHPDRFREADEGYWKLK